MSVIIDPRYLEILARPECDRDWVRSGVLESRGDAETRIAQVNAEIRSEYRAPTLGEQEELASPQMATATHDAIPGFP